MGMKETEKMTMMTRRMKGAMKRARRKKTPSRLL